MMTMTRKRALSFLLAFALFLSCLPAGFLMDVFAIGDGVAIYHDGKKADKVTLLQDGKISLNAEVSGLTADAYAWQILADKTWVNISGRNKAVCDVSYATVASLTDGNGRSQLRCKVTAGGEVYYSDAVTVQVSYTMPQYFDGPAEAEPALMSGGGSDSLSYAAGDDGVVRYEVMIQYLFESDNSQAAQPYVASIYEGTALQTVQPSPSVIGYAPYIMEGADYVEAPTVTIDLTDIRDDVLITVYYRPVDVTYTVNHHFQNIYDDNYDVDTPMISKSYTAPTGSLPPDNIVMTAEGFTSLFHEKIPVAADGSTVIDIYYDRGYHLVSFELGEGGYGTDPWYIRHGALVTVPEPTRTGYVFTGWELVEFNGKAPTEEEKVLYALSVPESGDKTVTVEVPCGNLTYRAIWTTTDTTYTVVYWRENANDDGYSFWGSVEHGAVSGESISGADNVPSSVTTNLVNGEQVDEKPYFTFNELRSDKNVIVEGDGSTVVNVYYSRNVYTMTFVVSGETCGLEEHTHGDGTCKRSLLCGVEHYHDDACLSCERKEHTHSGDCCTIEEHTTHMGTCYGACAHKHTLDCYSVNGNYVELILVDEGPTGSEPEYTDHGNGIHTYGAGNYNRNWTCYYLLLDGQWYVAGNDFYTSERTEITFSCSHTEHDESCLSCTLPLHTHGTGTCNGEKCADGYEHTHSEAENCYGKCTYETTHVHTDACYGECMLVEHTHNNRCMNPTSNTDNTVYVIRTKYQADIRDRFPIKNSTDDYTGYWWDDADNVIFPYYVVSLDSMTGADVTFEGTYKGDDATIWYYVEALPGEDGVASQLGDDNRKYTLYKEVITVQSGYLTEDEEFHNIDGFSKHTYYPNNIFSSTQKNNYLYYTRNQYTLHFHNYSDLIAGADKTVSFGELLKAYDLGEPGYPAGLEPNAYYFDGWYTTPKCYDGTEVDFNTATMPASDMTLYAKWSPKIHSVEFYASKADASTEGSTPIASQAIPHGNPTGYIDQPTNGNYKFAGWFYIDENGEEKAFLPQNMPVRHPIKLYAKWTSDVAVLYTIRYMLLDENGNQTDIHVAPTLEGSALAGRDKIFYAKSGSEMYTDYQSGHFPMIASHSLSMSVNGQNEFTFWYKPVDRVPYRVEYREEGTDAILHESREVLDNTKAVVTETFVPITGYMPDAYQKRLILTAAQIPEGETVAPENVLVFYYHEDKDHAYYKVVHEIQNLSRTGYVEYRSEEFVGDIGTTYEVEPLTIAGFAYSGGYMEAGSKSSTFTSTTKLISAELTAEGLLIVVQYDRIPVPYTVRYLEYGTNKVLHEEKPGTGRYYGETVTEDYVPIPGYTVDNTQKSLRIEVSEDRNVITFLYIEQYVTIYYQVVGEEGCGELTLGQENVPVVSGPVDGSVPNAYTGYRFAGWYLDEACTQPVPSEWIVRGNQKIEPQKGEDGLYHEATYYAKFEPELTSMTITKQYPEGENYEAVDPNQTFIFLIEGTDDKTQHITLRIVLKGNTSKTINELPIGSYKITEVSGWSWRYQVDGEAIRNVTLQVDKSVNAFAFTNTRQGAQWLDGNAYCENEFN